MNLHRTVGSAHRRRRTSFYRAVGLALGFPLIAATLICRTNAREHTDFAAMRRQIAALGQLTIPPRVHSAGGLATDMRLQQIFFEALSSKGQPTRVFAWLGLPPPRVEKYPGIVLVHGGSGTAFKDWVKKWNDHGFAAISIAVEGQTDEPRAVPASGGLSWQSHPWAGPDRKGIYDDSGEVLTEQWMYHAVADTILARLLLRSLAQVDSEKIGLMGISWGGVVTSTVIGIDSGFAFAIPVYGCGHLATADNAYGRALEHNAVYGEVWDPARWLHRAKLPVLWLSWPEDQYPVDCQAYSYRAAPGPRMVALLPGMGHSHRAAWTRPESYAFAESVARSGRPWLRQIASRVAGDAISVEFDSTKPLDDAVLISTLDAGITSQRTWSENTAKLEHREAKWQVAATLPIGTRAWFVNVRSGPLTASSDFTEREL